MKLIDDAYREKVARVVSVAQAIADEVQLEPQGITWGHVGDLQCVDEYLTLAAGLLGIDVDGGQQ